MYERFTDRARESLRIAHEEAKRLNHPQVDTEHLLLGLFKCGGTARALIFDELNIDVAEMLTDLELRMPAVPRVFAASLGHRVPGGR